jgi:hypothetical protein
MKFFRAALILAAFAPVVAFALPGQKWAQVDPVMHDWIMTLHAKGSGYWCCDLADGELTQQDIRKGADGEVHWFVFVDAEWQEVPDEAIVEAPNKIGRPIVWATHYGPQQVHINCFLPGALG